MGVFGSQQPDDIIEKLTFGVVMYVASAAKFFEFTAASMFAFMSCGVGEGLGFREVFGLDDEACCAVDVLGFGVVDKVLISFWFWKIK